MEAVEESPPARTLVDSAALVQAVPTAAAVLAAVLAALPPAADLTAAVAAVQAAVPRVAAAVTTSRLPLESHVLLSGPSAKRGGW